MKKLLLYILIFSLVAAAFSGCSQETPQVVATTLPVYEFTSLLCQGTGISVGQLVTENVSCLHDYTLQVSQMRMVEAAELVVISGAGLEEFLDDILTSKPAVIDSSADCHLHGSKHSHDPEDHAHNHDADPHIWLSPENAKVMVQNICQGLSGAYPDYSQRFADNMSQLLTQLDSLQDYGKTALKDLSCRNMITFHDGFGYFAEAFDLTILEAIEEESGSEASAQELTTLIHMVEKHDLPAIFTERNGSVSAADIIRAETGVEVYSLCMAMSGNSYFEAMYHNINTIKEALE